MLYSSEPSIWVSDVGVFGTDCLSRRRGSFLPTLLLEYHLSILLGLNPEFFRLSDRKHVGREDLGNARRRCS